MKIIIMLIFILSSLFATDSGAIRVQILEKIFSGLSVDEEIVIWSDNKKIVKLFKEETDYKIVSDCEDSNFIILEKTSDMNSVCLDKNIFVLNYKMLHEVPQSFGALFWKKGRPNIILLEPRVKAHSIKVDKDLEPYIEEKIW